MQGKAKSNWKLAVLVFEFLLELILVLITAGSAISFYVRDGDFEMIAFLLILAVCFAAGCGITISGFVRYKKGKKNILLSGLGRKVLVAWMGLGALFVWAKESTAAILFLVTGGLMIAAIVYAHFFSGKKKCEKRSKIRAEMQQKLQFSADKAKWRWDDVAEEYCRLHHVTLNALSEEDNCRIYEYAGSPIAYFLAWIIKHDFYSEEFLQEHGIQEIEAIRAELESPVVFLACEMDYVLTREDLSEKILPFVDYYYEGEELEKIRNGRPRTGRMHTYEDDYYAEVRNPQKLFYCIDFSWAIYHKLEERLDRRYRYHLIEEEACEEVSCDVSPGGEVRWELLNQTLELQVSNGVPQAYADRCVQHLNHLPEDTINRICSRIMDAFDCAGDISENQRSGSTVLNLLCSGSIRIFPPHGQEPAYVLGFECDFEEEHGIGWTMRGDEILDMGYRMDATSPWIYENEIAYRMAVAVQNISVKSIDTEEKARQEVIRGTLVAASPVMMNAEAAESGNNQFFVPQLAADLKDEYDIMIEKMLLEGTADACQCRPIYKPGSIVPSRLQIRATKGERVVFAAYVNIW